jgi:hypothetical protein
MTTPKQIILIVSLAPLWFTLEFLPGCLPKPVGYFSDHIPFQKWIDYRTNYGLFVGWVINLLLVTLLATLFF